MTIAALVVDLVGRGVTLEPDVPRLRVRPTSLVRPRELEALRAQKAEALGVAVLVAQYRRALRRGFALAAAGPTPTADQCADFLGEEVRLVACLGYELSAIVLSTEAAAWRRETGLNAFSGEPETSPGQTGPETHG